MKRIVSHLVAGGCLLVVAAVAGCAIGPDEATQAQAAAAHAKARRDWKVQLDGSGGKTDLPVERMDIFLVEEEDEYPEIFVIEGPDVTLVGEFPMDLHVGYEEDVAKLIGRTILINPSGGDPREPKTSWVRLGGMQVPVTGGSFKIEKFTGKWDGQDGDKTAWGTIEVRVPGTSGDRTLRGKFAVHYVAWG